MHIGEVSRSMLNEKDVLDFYWAKAVAIAVYIMNRTPIAAIHGMTLEERYTSRKPNISHLKILVALPMFMCQMS